VLNWTDHVTAVANQTLLPKANHSWYLAGIYQVNRGPLCRTLRA